MPIVQTSLARPVLWLGLLWLFAGVNPKATDSSVWLDRAWQSDDGLPDNSVSGVAEYPDGYLWVATLGGLVRFDGARFQEFSPVNIPGVPNRVVRALFLDRRGRLWLGMDRGPVVCVEPEAARVFTTQDGLPDLHMTMMTEDGEGAIWIAYATGALSRINLRTAVDEPQRSQRAQREPFTNGLEHTR